MFIKRFETLGDYNPNITLLCYSKAKGKGHNNLDIPNDRISENCQKKSLEEKYFYEVGVTNAHKKE